MLPAIGVPQGFLPHLTACKAKQEYAIVRIHVFCDGLKCSFPQGPSYGKPGHDGVNHLEFAEACSLFVSREVDATTEFLLCW